jgi:hypothetical protein
MPVNSNTSKALITDQKVILSGKPATAYNRYSLESNSNAPKQPAGSPGQGSNHHQHGC